MAIDEPAPSGTIGFYASFRTGGDFERLYARGEETSILRYLSNLFFDGPTPPIGATFEIVGLPSRSSLDDKEGHDMPRLLDQVVVRLRADEKTWEVVQDATARLGDKSEFVGVGIDLPVHATRHWCPATGGGPFADRAAAEGLIGVDALRLAQPLAKGQGVNVALFDHGIDATKIPSRNFGGGRPSGTKFPGTTVGNGHGLAMVRQILSIAPDAIIFDYPVLPSRIKRVPAFLSEIDAAYDYLLARASLLKGRWVVVNAWSTFDRTRERPRGSYSNNPFHLLNRKITKTVDAGVDVVFAAGNCGQFCPDQRCGRNDRGPGGSILGANSHPRVLTVGAVRSDGLWLGYSSQGEGQPNLAKRKPDLCASSDFREAYDAGLVATGTSAACALTAGVIAALRSKWPATAISPDQLRGILTSTARQTEGTGWNDRLGHGILNATAAFDAAAAATAPEA